MNRSLIFAVLASGCLALIVTLALSRRILGPVDSLTAAARRIETGDLSQKITVRSKDEIGVLAQAFNSMTEKLAKTEELRRNMVSDIAHELRTPLTNIRCQLETLQDGLARPDQTIINSLHDEAMLLGSLIDDLQELALADAGKLCLDRRPVPTNDLISEAASALCAQAQEKQIKLRIEQGVGRLFVDADARRIGQVLRNLLGNAIAHTAAGGRIVISWRQVDAQVEISVRDSGEGIAPEHLPYVFERFYRTDDSRARTTGGAGLGLAIVKQLVNAHGGQVWAESIVGHGSVFIFTLPVSNVVGQSLED